MWQKWSYIPCNNNYMQINSVSVRMCVWNSRIIKFGCVYFWFWEDDANHPTHNQQLDYIQAVLLLLYRLTTMLQRWYEDDMGRAGSCGSRKDECWLVFGQIGTTQNVICIMQMPLFYRGWRGSHLLRLEYSQSVSYLGVRNGPMSLEYVIFLMKLDHY